jgi:hypothetical protein
MLVKLHRRRQKGESFARTIGVFNQGNAASTFQYRGQVVGF